MLPLTLVMALRPAENASAHGPGGFGERMGDPRGKRTRLPLTSAPAPLFAQSPPRRSQEAAANASFEGTRPSCAHMPRRAMLPTFLVSSRSACASKGASSVSSACPNMPFASAALSAEVTMRLPMTPASGLPRTRPAWPLAAGASLLVGVVGAGVIGLEGTAGAGVLVLPLLAAAVTAELRLLAPVLPEVRVSALGTDAVVDGCLAAGAELAWRQLMAQLPSAAAPIWL